MKSTMIRFCSLVLCLCLLITSLPVHAFAAEKNNEHSNVLTRFEESFETSNYFINLRNEQDYSYKLWVNEIDSYWAVAKVVVWCSDYLLENRLTEDAYIEYLSELLALMDQEYMNSTIAESEFSDKMMELTGTGFATCADSINVSVEALCGDSYKSLTNTIDNLSLTVDWINLADEVISDLTQLEVLMVASLSRDNKVSILKAIRDHTDDQNLRKAADTMIEVSNAQFIHLLDNYAWKEAVLTLKTTFAVTVGTSSLSGVASKIITNSGDKFVTWLQSSVGVSVGRTAAVSTLLSGAAKLISAAGAIAVGLKLGGSIMKVLVGEEAELFREMTAMDKISDALAEAFAEAKADSSSGVSAKRYENVKLYAILGETLIVTHYVGERCFLEIKDNWTVEKKDEYWYWLNYNMERYQKILEGIFPGAYYLNTQRRLARVNAYFDDELNQIVAFYYNNNNQLVNANVEYFEPGVGANLKFTFTYDDAGRLVSADRDDFWLYYGNDEYVYNSFGQLLSHKFYWGGGDLPYWQCDYEYDPLGNVASEAFLVPNENGDALETASVDTYSYVYDDQGRIAEKHTHLDKDSNYSITTEYGNYPSSEYVIVTKYTYDSQDRVLSTQEVYLPRTMYDPQGNPNLSADKGTTQWYCYDYPIFVSSGYGDGYCGLFINDVMGHEIWSIGVGESELVIEDGYIIEAIDDYNGYRYEFIYEDTSET